MGYNNSTYKGEYRPVESIDYEEIMSFLKKLNTMTGIKFRLLTEAEWEFAARGGLFSKGYVYSGSDNLEEVGWTGNTNPTKVTHNVANKAPNSLAYFHNKTEVYLPFGAGTPLISLARLELQRSIGGRTAVELYFVDVNVAVKDGIDGKSG